MKRAILHLQSVLEHDAVTAPRQVRSQRTLDRILNALGELLSEKSFDQISMLELAARAGCAVTSIYARFKDKWSMIAALHEGFRDDAIFRIDTFLAPERWQGATADAILAATTAALVAAYHEHRHLMRAVLLTDDRCVYGRAASVEQHAAERLVRALPVPAGVSADAFRKRVEFGILAVMAALQRRVLFDTDTKPWSARANAELAQELADLLTAYIECPQRNGHRGGSRPKSSGKHGRRPPGMAE